MPVTAGTLMAGTAGAVLLWSAVTGNSASVILRDIIRGQKPGTVPSSNANAESTGGGSVTSGGVGEQNAAQRKANQALGRAMASSYGWGTGAEWTALNSIVMAESGWDADIKNPASSASGIAQNINGFGAGYQKGNAFQQIAWMLSYIKGRYGDPVAAWQFHLTNGYY